MKKIIIESSFGGNLAESMKKEGFKAIGYNFNGFPVVKKDKNYYDLTLCFDDYGRRYYSLEKIKKSQVDFNNNSIPEL